MAWQCGLGEWQPAATWQCGLGEPLNQQQHGNAGLGEWEPAATWQCGLGAPLNQPDSLNSAGWMPRSGYVLFFLGI